jgi:arylamine N-acetyltransferase
VLQEQANDEWVDLYAFVPDPVPHVDIEVSNWYTCTSPRSPFVTGLVVASVDDGGMRTMLRGSWSEDGSDSGSGSGEVALTEDTPGASTVTPVARKQIPELLAERFGLSGFGLGEDGRVVAV